MRAILTYHSIDSSGSPISISEESFRGHIRFFGSGRVRVVPLAELAALPDETDAVTLTFDDGFLNFTSAVLPSLAHLGFPATVFVAEPLGRDTIMETRLADQVVTAKVPGLVSLEPGTPVWLGVDANQLHVFDKHTGNAIRFARHDQLTTMDTSRL